jgi:hypothetical protein
MAVLLKVGFAFQENVEAPDPESETDVPGQMLTSFPASTVGRVFTVTFILSTSVQTITSTEAVAESVYVVVAAGVAIGLAMFGLFSPTDGLHAYAVPPEPLRVVLEP